MKMRTTTMNTTMSSVSFENLGKNILACACVIHLFPAFMVLNLVPGLQDIKNTLVVKVQL